MYIKGPIGRECIHANTPKLFIHKCWVTLSDPSVYSNEVIVVLG